MTPKFLLLSMKFGIGLLPLTALWMLASQPFGIISRDQAEAFFAGCWFATWLGAAIASMSRPTDESGPLYKFMFKFGHMAMCRAESMVERSALARMFASGIVEREEEKH